MKLDRAAQAAELLPTTAPSTAMPGLQM